MAKFDESKVISALHPEKAEVGKKYWFADAIAYLKSSVESDYNNVFVLSKIVDGSYPFVTENDSKQLLYPYEEPANQRMTRRQFAEWIAKSNGEYRYKGTSTLHRLAYSYSLEEENEDVEKDIVIRSWDSEEWVEPTVDIYERDCKGGK